MKVVGQDHIAPSPSTNRPIDLQNSAGLHHRQKATPKSARSEMFSLQASVCNEPQSRLMCAVRLIVSAMTRAPSLLNSSGASCDAAPFAQSITLSDIERETAPDLLSEKIEIANSQIAASLS